MTEIVLSVREHCAEDETVTVAGRLAGPIDLVAAETSARRATPNVLRMERLGVLSVILEEATVHLHADGEVVVSGVRDEAAARRALQKTGIVR